MRKMNKKGADISITVIIVAAIALIVFVVLVAIFTDQAGKFTFGLKRASGDVTKDCKDIDATFTTRSKEDCNTQKGTTVPSRDTINSDFVCCTK